MIEMLEQHGLSVHERQRQAFGRADRELRTLVFQQAEVIVGETGRVEMRFVVQFQRADDLFEVVIVHPGVVAAAAIETTDLDAAATEDPGAGMTEIGQMIIILRLVAGVGHIGERRTAAGAALDDRLLDLGPGTFLALDERLQRAFRAHRLRRRFFKLAGLHLQVAAGSQAGEADVRGAFMGQRQPPVGVTDRVILLRVTSTLA